MKEIILEFLEWMPENLEDIFELVDSPGDVVNKYIEQLKQNKNDK